MKTWNRTGKLKALIIVLLSLANFFFPINVRMEFSFLVFTAVPLVFAVVMIPLSYIVSSESKGAGFVKPHWNDSLYAQNKPLSKTQFYAYFILSIGLNILLGTAIEYHYLSKIGLGGVCFGIGTMIGLKLISIRVKKKEMQ